MSLITETIMLIISPLKMTKKYLFLMPKSCSEVFSQKRFGQYWETVRNDNFV